MSDYFPKQTLNEVLPAYVYAEYQDDDAVRAFFDAYNTIVQRYVDAFNQLNLPIYTSENIIGPFADWVLNNIYGQQRPVLFTNFGQIDGLIGDFDVLGGFFPLGEIRVNQMSTYMTVNDDIYKRITTWNFYRGDGLYFNERWLKRRIMRFLIGVNGTAPNIDQTYAISVVWQPIYVCNITIFVTVGGLFSDLIANILAEAINNRVCLLPFQITFNITVSNSSGLYNDGGVLAMPTLQPGWPISNIGLAVGMPWSNGLVVSVTPGATYNPGLGPLYFATVTAAELLTLNLGEWLSTTPPGVIGQLYLDPSGQEVWISP